MQENATPHKTAQGSRIITVRYSDFAAAAGAAAETVWASFANIEKMESEGGSPDVVASGAALRMGEEVVDEAVRVARRAAVGRTDRFAASAGDGESKPIRD